MGSRPGTYPIAVEVGALWREISLGRVYTCGIRDDGTRSCTGANDSGQLGDGTMTRSYGMVEVQTY